MGINIELDEWFTDSEIATWALEDIDEETQRQLYVDLAKKLKFNKPAEPEPNLSAYDALVQEQLIKLVGKITIADADEILAKYK